MDGAGKAAVGVDHNSTGPTHLYGTYVKYENIAFRNFLVAGYRDGVPTWTQHAYQEAEVRCAFSAEIHARGCHVGSHAFAPLEALPCV
jgi:hypothetical protein